MASSRSFTSIFLSTAICNRTSRHCSRLIMLCLPPGPLGLRNDWQASREWQKWNAWDQSWIAWENLPPDVKQNTPGTPEYPPSGTDFVDFHCRKEQAVFDDIQRIIESAPPEEQPALYQAVADGG